MKKKMAMAVMALAVSAMAGSAFAANEPAKTTGSSAPLKMVNTDGTDALLKPIFNLEQMAKEKGITVEELIKQLEKEGKLTKGAAINTKDSDLTTSFSFMKFDANSDNSKTIDLEEMAKEKGISVEELIEQLKEEGTLEMIASTTTINLEEVAKEKGISVEELIKQLEKEGTIATGEAASFTHPSISLEQMAKEMGISVEELIKQLEKEGKITKGTTVSVAAIKK
ncbi:hypothetical protein [Brevibacillus sp. BC25]|uniref:hypothetical protein n=1 Tax=Brevibacillus sp. BC25 TaxID=1144308 RepID=UPI0002710B98|nr:hypothetical protein [Brevibacillus sp. BC25]EJL25347.1 hypothetical protein PMI05_03863 [Brevibacillus sp. BC25]